MPSAAFLAPLYHHKFQETMPTPLLLASYPQAAKLRLRTFDASTGQQKRVQTEFASEHWRIIQEKLQEHGLRLEEHEPSARLATWKVLGLIHVVPGDLSTDIIGKTWDFEGQALLNYWSSPSDAYTVRVLSAHPLEFQHTDACYIQYEKGIDMRVQRLRAASRCLVLPHSEHCLSILAALLPDLADPEHRRTSLRQHLQACGVAADALPICLALPEAVAKLVIAGAWHHVVLLGRWHGHGRTVRLRRSRQRDGGPVAETRAPARFTQVPPLFSNTGNCDGSDAGCEISVEPWPAPNWLQEQQRAVASGQHQNSRSGACGGVAETLPDIAQLLYSMQEWAPQCLQLLQQHGASEQASAVRKAMADHCSALERLANSTLTFNESLKHRHAKAKALEHGISMPGREREDQVTREGRQCMHCRSSVPIVLSVVCNICAENLVEAECLSIVARQCCIGPKHSWEAKFH